MNVQAVIETLNQAIADTAAELGCGPDNEAILRAIAKLRADRDALLEALERVVEVTGIEDAHLSNFGEFSWARSVIAQVKGERP